VSLSSDGKLSNRESRSWAFVAQGIVAITGLTSVTVVARLLGPVEFGLYFIAFTCAAVLGILLDSCVGQAILTRSPGFETSWRSWRRDSVVIASLGAGLSVVAASFFIDSADLTVASWLLAVSIPMTVASMVPRALILLSGNVRSVALADSLAGLIANAASILTVYWTGSLAGAAMSAILLAIIRLVVLALVRRHSVPVSYYPVSKFRWVIWRSYWREMAGTYQSQLVNFLSRTADNLIIAVVLGPVSLAQYSRAFSFVIGPAQQAQMALTPTAIRDFASITSEEAGLAMVRKLSSRLFVLLIPGVVVLSLSGPVVTDELLGPGWETAGELMRLSVGLAVSTILSMPARWVLLSKRNNRALRIDSYSQLGLLAGVVIGSILGGVSGALVASSYVVAPLASLMIWRLTGSRTNSVYLTKLLPLGGGLVVISALCAGVVAWSGVSGSAQLLLLLAIGCVISALFWLINEAVLKRAIAGD